MNRLRRRVLAAAGGAAALPWMRLAAAQEKVATRPIPRTGEALPVVGIGTAVIFDFESDPARSDERRAVIRALVEGGGRLIDTAPAYGRAEDRLGEIVSYLGMRERLFLATKFAYESDRAAAEQSMRASLRRLHTDRVELMQAWNVRDGNFSLAQLREWQKQGICKYTGITISQVRDYGAIAKVLAREKPDFLQVNYSLGNREPEAVLLPLARDSGAAVLTNLPFGRNTLFRKAGNRPLPDFAAEFGAKTWAQFFLKFILSHPVVTAVIPGTDRPEYMLDNLQAGRGPLPDAEMRSRMVKFWDSF